MRTILTINSGSSSLKLGLYRIDDSDRASEPTLLYRGATDAIGKPGGSLTVTDDAGNLLHHEDAAHDSQSSAFAHAAQKLRELSGSEPAAIGYRVVHGGPHLVEHCRITPEVLDTLRASTHYAPLHIPAALALIDTASKLYPHTPAFACFDTAFHTTMPPEAFTYAIPARFRDQGVRRYGFHGLSYESVIAAFRASPGAAVATAVPARLVVAHLGNGASLCAIANGRSVDTSMGLTPTGGIPMGTRTGDLDPGVVLFLARSGNVDSGGEAGDSARGGAGDSARGGAGNSARGGAGNSARGGVGNLDHLESILNHESGLVGLSSSTSTPGSSDLRELTAAANEGSATANQALAIFCRSIAKSVASYGAVLGGIDTLVFTGGIGEHSVLVREQVCRQLAFLGITIDDDANRRHATTISQPTSSIGVQILLADEDGRIAHHVRRLLSTVPPDKIRTDR